MIDDDTLDIIAENYFARIPFSAIKTHITQPKVYRLPLFSHLFWLTQSWVIW